MSQSKLLQRKHLLTSMYKNDFIAFVSLAYKIVHPGKEIQKISISNSSSMRCTAVYAVNTIALRSMHRRAR